MTHYFIIPGFQGSGADHWQTWFERKHPDMIRILQDDWNQPNMDSWIANINNTLKDYHPESVILVAHSLGCLTVAEWAKRFQGKVKAALLVAPPDTVQVSAKISNRLFEEPPLQPLPFRSILVTSSNDPWISVDRASEYQKLGKRIYQHRRSGAYQQSFGIWGMGTRT